MSVLDLLPTAEVARQLGVNVKAIHRMVDAKKLVPVTKGPGPRGAYLFNPGDVERLKAERTTNLPAEAGVA
jgi:DNA-binding transcriptional MerR regulator